MRSRRLRSLPSLAVVASLAVAALGAPPRRASAEDPPAPPPGSMSQPGPEIAVPRAEGMTLDGAPNEAAWASAAAIPCDERGGLHPVVKVLASAGRLWVLADVPEDPGVFGGVRWLVGPEGTKTSADASNFAFAPQDSRAPRFSAHGPRGVGRAFYRFAGAADLTLAGRWTMETALPFADLDLPTDTTPIRLAVAVALRTPNLFAAAPAGSAFGPIGSFARLRPPEGGWAAGAHVATTEADAKATADDDATDRKRLVEWNRFLGVWQAGGGAGGQGVEKLLEPIDSAIAQRPDLAFLRLVKSDLLASTDAAGARASILAALGIIPNLREGRWSLAQLDVNGWIEAPDTQPSDYDAAFAKLAEAAKSRRADDPGLALAGAVLHHRHGDWAEAAPLFEQIIGKYPVGDDTSAMALANKKYAEHWSYELSFRERDAKRDDLPRARVTTSKGAFVLELFEEDAPNTVRNFVYLAQKKFYDGTKFHRVVPFFMDQGGDPLSKPNHPQIGQGGPGYAIPTETSSRLPFRGVVAMASTGKDTEGSQFFVTTGTSAHLEGGYSIFGRVLSGQDVVDKIVHNDTIESVVIERQRGHDYHPITVSGKPAPEPVATAPTHPPMPPPVTPKPPK